jgi:hypothetical protein
VDAMRAWFSGACVTALLLELESRGLGGSEDVGDIWLVAVRDGSGGSARDLFEGEQKG